MKCGETFDKLVKPGGNGSVPCIHCQEDTKRVFSPVGIIFKGSGFYSTDYRPGSSKKSADPLSKSPKDKKQEDKKTGTEKASGEKPAEKASSAR